MCTDFDENGGVLHGKRENKFQSQNFVMENAKWNAPKVMFFKFGQTSVSQLCFVRKVKLMLIQELRTVQITGFERARG